MAVREKLAEAMKSAMPTPWLDQPRDRNSISCLLRARCERPRGGRAAERG
jgi:hypothetical protein